MFTTVLLRYNRHILEGFVFKLVFYSGILNRTMYTNKGKKSLIYDGFIYRIDGVLKCGDISWRCTNKKCKGRLIIDSAMSTMNAINLEHNHEQDEKKLKDSNCDLMSKGKQRTISPPDLQKSLVQRLANGSTIVEFRYLFYGLITRYDYCMSNLSK